MLCFVSGLGCEGHVAQLAFSELKQYRGVVAMVDGGFDPLHHGHIAYFEAAAGLGAAGARVLCPCPVLPGNPC